MELGWLDPGKLLVFTAFVLPGFIAWKVSQLRIPHGEQKPQDVILEIVGYGMVNALLVSIFRIAPTQWTVWPTDFWHIVALGFSVLIMPAALAWGASLAMEQLATWNFFVSGTPTAWDRLALARLRKQILFVLITLRDGKKVGGIFSKDGYASNYPYGRDILIDLVWEIDQATAEFVRLVAGEAGLYVRGDDILTLEVFEYEAMLEKMSGRKGT